MVESALSAGFVEGRFTARKICHRFPHKRNPPMIGVRHQVETVVLPVVAHVTEVKS
jgi:hypothetical protein